MRKSTKSIAVGTMIAGIAGYLAGVLTAPKSGQETRDMIANATNSSIAETEKQLKKLHTELGKLIDEAHDKSKNSDDLPVDEVPGQISSATEAKSKVRDIISALHEGEAQDKDLQKVIKEASKAIDHFRAFLKK